MPTIASTAQTPRMTDSTRLPFFQVVKTPPIRNPARASRTTTITEWDTRPSCRVFTSPLHGGLFLPSLQKTITQACFFSISM